MLSTPPAKIHSAIDVLILAAAKATDSSPDEQYLFTVIPGTLTVLSPNNEIILPIFRPCSASGVALPTITSLIKLLSNPGIFLVI